MVCPASILLSRHILFGCPVCVSVFCFLVLGVLWRPYFRHALGLFFVACYVGWIPEFLLSCVRSRSLVQPSHDYAHTKAETQGSNQRNKQQQNRPRACRKYERQRTRNARKQKKKNRQGPWSANKIGKQNMINTDLGKWTTEHHCNPKRMDENS